MASEQEPKGLVASILGKRFKTKQGLELVVTDASTSTGYKLGGVPVPISTIVLNLVERPDIHVICSWSALNDIVQFRSSVTDDIELPLTWMQMQKYIKTLDDVSECLSEDSSEHSLGLNRRINAGNEYPCPESWLLYVRTLEAKHQAYGS